MPLDEFLEGAGSAIRFGERLDLIGSLLSIPTLLAVIGITVFALVVFRGAIGELTLLLTVCVWCGVAALVGAVVETIGTFQRLGLGWSDVLSDERLWSPVMRWLAATTVVGGYVFEISRLERDDHDASEMRWRPGGGAVVGIIGALVAVLSFTFDGHTVSQGPRLVHALVNPVHVVAGSVWLGGILSLVVMGRWRRAHEGPSLGRLVVTFSTVATGALVVAGVAGVVMTTFIIDGVSELWQTPWGRFLLGKVWLVVFAGAIGAYNHFVLAPALDRDPDDTVANARIRTTLATESLLLVSVAVFTVFLSGASIN